jgi:hypothetical protein
MWQAKSFHRVYAQMHRERVFQSGDRKRIVKLMFFRNIIFLKSPFRQGYGLPFLASYCGNNSGTDMLEQYGDFGIK